MDMHKSLSGVAQARSWRPVLTLLLGMWLMASPFVFGYVQPDWGPLVAQVTLQRNLPSPDLRAHWMQWSDLFSGVLVAAFGALAGWRSSRWAPWAGALVGVWLLIAPLLFWAPKSVMYLNDTVLAVLVIVFALLLPDRARAVGATVPPGWRYNPSACMQRVPVMMLALLGFLVSHYLAAYQLGYLRHLWDPVFGSGSEQVVTSPLSRMFPVPDAGMGAIIYLLEALSAFKGDRGRWHSMPWTVAGFGLLVLPLLLVSVGFIIIQPIVIGAMCFICFFSALATVLMIPLALDEIAAMVEYLVRGRQRGEPFWRCFFGGGQGMEGAVAEGFLPGRDETGPFQGMGFSWNLMLSAVIGVFLILSRWLWPLGAVTADNNHLVGVLVFTVSLVAMAEVARTLRFVNVLFGCWLLIAPWVLSGGVAAEQGISMALGLGLIALSLPRGRITASYGAWQKAIR